MTQDDLDFLAIADLKENQVTLVHLENEVPEVHQTTLNRSEGHLVIKASVVSTAIQDPRVSLVRKAIQVLLDATALYSWPIRAFCSPSIHKIHVHPNVQSIPFRCTKDTAL